MSTHNLPFHDINVCFLELSGEIRGDSKTSSN